MTGFRAYPAPYIPDPERLVCFASNWPNAAFVRTCDPGEPEHVTDIFYAGQSRAWCGYHNRKSPGSWQQDYQQMLQFKSGAPLVGYFPYEFGYQFEPHRWNELPCAEGQPVFRFLEMDVWYQADHFNRTANILAAPGASHDTILEFTQLVEDAVAGLVSASDSSGAAAMEIALETVAAVGELSRREYVAAVDCILEDIRAGRYYELNFTQRFRHKSAVPPQILFPRLVEKLQPAFAFYGQFDDEVIVSASPELFLHKHGSVVQTCPIKGSYRDTPSPAEMTKLHAEHTMVVDLARNDLGRISDRGWVQVAEQAAARQFGKITHLESRITGRSGRSLDEILAATLPAASITGTPKVISVQSIAQYERSPRGIYTGNCGVLWPDGDVQLNVAIRTLRASNDPDHSDDEWQYTLGSGGAIVADSDPEQEYQECLMKVAPLLQELGMDGKRATAL